MLAAIWEFLTVTLPGLSRAWFAGREFRKKNRDALVSRAILQIGDGVSVQDITDVVGDPAGVSSRWVRLEVTNLNTLTPARKVMAYISSVQDAEAGYGRESIPGQQRPTDWEGKRFKREPVDIPHGRKERVDVMYFRDDQSTPGLCCYPGVRLPARGSFRVAVLVVAENSEPQARTLRITWDGSWTTLKAERV